MIKLPSRCPICDAKNVAWLRRFMSRLGTEVDLFYCMECESFCSPFCEPNPVTNQVNWHVSKIARNTGWTSAMITALLGAGVRGPLVDIGCGIGTLMDAARAFGLEGVGYDIDVDSIAFGRDLFGLDLRGELWGPESVQDFGLITCVMVLEHLHQPRKLIGDMIKAAKERGACVYISVPWIDRADWHRLHSNSQEPGHYFEYPHVHVTHLSHKAIGMVAEQFGAKSVERFDSRDFWSGVLIRT